MTKTTCFITFDHSDKVYFCGESLNCDIVLKLPEIKIIKEIVLSLSGKAYAYWTEGNDDSTSHFGKEYYIRTKTHLIDNRIGFSKFEAGTYNYPFKWTIPYDFPSSTIGRHGYIRYVVQVVVNLFKQRNVIVKEEFTVIKSLNLNEYPNLRSPLELVTKKAFSWCCLFCCCNSNYLFLIGRLPASGYCPGEVIPLELRVINGSDRKVSHFKIEFVKILTQPYKNKKKCISDTTTYSTERTKHGCHKNASEQYHINVLIASTQPTDITSDICRIEYALIITGNVGCCHTNPVLKIPIIIGTVPFMKYGCIENHDYSADRELAAHLEEALGMQRMTYL